MHNIKNTEAFDAIVVGSGPSGATIARNLSKLGKRVLILERGSNRVHREGFWRFISILNSVSVGDGLAMTRAFTTGGTTALYFGAAEFPPLKGFLSYGIDLTKDVEAVRKELPLAPLPDELLGQQTIRIRDSAAKLGLTWKKTVMLIDQDRCRSGYAYDAKWTAKSYVDEAVANGAKLVTRATVDRVLVENNRAVGVQYKTGGGKRSTDTHRVYGDKIVLAAGGLASPIILRNSGLKNVVSRGFYCDPGFIVMGEVPDLKGGDLFSGTMGGGSVDGISVGDACLPRTFYRMYMLQHGKFLRLFSHHKSIGIGVIVRDAMGGELRSNGSFYKKLSAEEIEKLNEGEKIAREIIRSAGGRKAFRGGIGSVNAGGMLGINEHLDARLQTEFENLHVCDSSVIPENIRLSPTLTLVCLGGYLARNLY